EVIAMIYRRTSVRRASMGQSMIETVLMLPLLLLLLLNAVNFGFYFFVTLNLTAAPRTSAEYSTMGFDTPSAISLPDSGPPSGTLTSSYITQQDMTGAVYNPTAASIQICSETNLDTTTKSGVNGSGSTQSTNSQLKRERGQAQVEFALTIVFLMLLFVGFIELVMMIYAYNVLADSAKEGVRYAVVHGSLNANASGPTCPCADIDGPPAPLG